MTTTKKMTPEVRAVAPRVRTVMIYTTRRLTVAASLAIGLGLIFSIAPSARAQSGYPTKVTPQSVHAAPQGGTYAAPQQTVSPMLPLAPSAPLATTAAPIQLYPAPAAPVKTLVPAAPMMIHPAPQAQTTFAAPQAFATGQFASSQSGCAPCACYYPRGFCPFPQGNCAFPQGNCSAPCGNCSGPIPSSQWPTSSPQGFGAAASGQVAPVMIGD
jgi:hypothetical protein